jgi:hypothetical protein
LKDIDMKIFACLNVYCEEALLEDCIKSVRDVLPTSEIILIDGAYESWISQVKVQAAKELEGGNGRVGNSMLRFTSPVSCDATLDIAKRMGVEHIVMPPKNETGKTIQNRAGTWEPGEYMPWECEWKKRATFFTFGQDGDYYVIVDADERIRGTLPELKEDHYSIMLKRDDNVAAYVVHRVFKHRPDLKMEGAHMAVWHGSKLLRKDEAPVLPGVTLDHRWNYRASNDRVRHMAKGAYYRNGLMPEEHQFRMVHDI